MRKFLSVTMIDIDVTKYAFVDESIAQKICDVINIKLIKLMKKRVIKTYDDKKKSSHHSCHLFKCDYSESYKKSHFYVDHEVETTSHNTE